MTPNDLNKYYLTSLEEPTDEMLSTIMKEVAEEAMRRNEEAHKRFFNDLRRENVACQKKWESIIRGNIHHE